MCRYRAGTDPMLAVTAQYLPCTQYWYMLWHVYGAVPNHFLSTGSASSEGLTDILKSFIKPQNMQYYLTMTGVLLICFDERYVVFKPLRIYRYIIVLYSYKLLGHKNTGLGF